MKGVTKVPAIGVNFLFINFFGGANSHHQLGATLAPRWDLRRFGRCLPQFQRCMRGTPGFCNSAVAVPLRSGESTGERFKTSKDSTRKRVFRWSNSWPFYPLVGGHLIFEGVKNHHPKKVTKNHLVVEVFFWQFDSGVWGRYTDRDKWFGHNNKLHQLAASFNQGLCWERTYVK